MIGDRVKISSNFSLENQAGAPVVPVYEPVWNPDGSIVWNDVDGTANIRKVGGVKAGTTGTIEGDPIVVQSAQLLHLTQQTSMVLGGTKDVVKVFPVWLDHYQQRGWFPVDHLTIVAGGRL